jgi:aldose 1-epimerase
MKIKTIDYPNPQYTNVKLFELKNEQGTSVKITNIGATIVGIETKDKNANFSNIVLGFDNPEAYISQQYLNNCCYLGSTIGRFANRIARGKFNLNGKTYHLAVNNGNNHLHGGPTGFHQKIWTTDIEQAEAGETLVMRHTSPDNDEGFPGQVGVEVRFYLSSENELIINYEAKSDASTPVNLTNHSYFNLSGKDTDILSHEVMLFADEYTPKEDNIPTGDTITTKNTPFDFKEFHKVGERLHQLPKDAYDHNLVLNGKDGELKRAAVAKDPESGRALEVYTTLPGIQFYSGYNLDGQFGNKEKKFDRFGGLCFETQYFPDSPNHPTFPSCITTPENPFRHTTVFKFTIEP